MRTKFGGKAKFNADKPLSHPVHAALKEMRDAGQVEAHESSFGEPRFSAKGEMAEEKATPAPETDYKPRKLREGDKVTGRYMIGIHDGEFSGTVTGVSQDTAGGGFGSAYVKLDPPMKLREGDVRDSIILTVNKKDEFQPDNFTVLYKKKSEQAPDKPAPGFLFSSDDEPISYAFDPHEKRDTAGRWTTGKAFASDVMAAHGTAPEGSKFGPNKVFVHKLHSHLAATNPAFKDMPLAEFKERLMDAMQQGQIELSRADLVQAMDPKDVEESTIKHPLGMATFNFVTDPGAYKRPAAKPKAKKPTKEEAMKEKWRKESEGIAAAVAKNAIPAESAKESPKPDGNPAWTTDHAARYKTLMDQKAALEKELAELAKIKPGDEE